MTGDDELDRGPPKAFDDIEVLLTGPPEDSVDPSFSRAATRRSNPFMFDPRCSPKSSTWSKAALR
jgi:hypothetical protein